MPRSRTVTRAELREAVYRKVGLSRRESSKLVDQVLGEITDTLAGGEAVKIASFGSFMIKHKRERFGRNPKTGAPVVIAPRQVLIFRPSKLMKKKVGSDCGNFRDLSNE